MVLTILFVPLTQINETAKGVIASAFYVENWVLADNAVDYLAADSATSPVQHFWSLSVEEQFYLFRSEEHTSELQSLMRISYAVFCLKKKKNTHTQPLNTYQ